MSKYPSSFTADSMDQRRALRQIADLLSARDLDDVEAELRARQLVEHVTSAPCPELAFDPLAGLLDDIDVQLAARADGGSACEQWRQRVVALVQGSIGQRTRAAIAA